MKKLLLLSIAILMLFSAVACSNTPADVSTPTDSNSPAAADNSLQAVKDKGKLVLGLDDAFPPMGFKDEKGDIVGFDIDIAREVCKRLGIELELQSIDWDTKELELNGGNIDCIWNGFSITDERKKQVLFSTPYMTNRQIIVVMDGSPIKTKADLSGKKVVAQTASAAMSAIEAQPEVKNTFAQLLQMKEYVTALIELKSGTVDAVVVDETVGRYYIANSKEKYFVLEDNFGTEEYGVGFRMQDKALCDAVNEQIAAMIQDGTAKTISMKWFGEDVTAAK